MSLRRALAISSVFILAAVVMFVYASSLTTGFFADDYNFLEPVARLNLPDYLVHYFDPRVQVLWYRPLQGIQFLVEWKLFGANATSYHIVNILFHVINSTLLFGLVWRIAGKWHWAFVAAFLYATFPVYALAVNWINISDPLATIFYLLGIWFWWSYLEHDKPRDLVLTVSAYVLGLLCKQMVITLPAILFLLDRLLFGWRVPDHGSAIQRFLAWLDVPQILRRYGAFAVVLIMFAGLQYGTQSTHTFAGVFGYSPSLQILSILIQYASLSVFPWGYFLPTDTQITEGMPFSDERNLIWLAVAILIYLFITVRWRSRVLVFLGLAWLILILPVLPFPFVELRYLYLPIMTSGVVLGLVFDRVVSHFNRPRIVGALAGMLAALIVAGSSISIANANAGIFEIARQRRVPFRDIVRQHPSFPDGTQLYFIDPITPLPELTGMFLMQYGRGVSVSGDRAVPVTRLRDYSNVLVYHFDPTGKPLETSADLQSTYQTSQTYPVVFESSIVLDDAEIVRPSIKRGDPLIVLLHWHAANLINQDYTVFIHLLDPNGNLIAGYDHQPRKETAPTSQWHQYIPIVDPILLTIPEDAPPENDYRLEIGLYYSPTMRRLAIVDAAGQPRGDSFTIRPLSVMP